MHSRSSRHSAVVLEPGIKNPAIQAGAEPKRLRPLALPEPARPASQPASQASQPTASQTPDGPASQATASQPACRPAKPASQAKPSQARPGQARPGQARPGQAKPCQARPGQPARPGQARSSSQPASQPCGSVPASIYMTRPRFYGGMAGKVYEPMVAGWRERESRRRPERL